MTTLGSLWQAVEDAPDDWAAWLVLADALDDAEHAEGAFACRWLATREKAPLWVSRGQGGLWYWLRFGRGGGEVLALWRNLDPDACLPRLVFDQLPGVGSRAWAVQYRTLYDAVRGLAEALEYVRLVIEVKL